MKNKKTLNLKNFGKFVEVVISKLDNGQNRFSTRSKPQLPLNSVCFIDFPAPDYSERLISDYGMPSKSNNKDIEKEYFEEVTLIEELIEEYKIPIDLSDWQKGDLHDFVKDINKNLNRRNLAVQIWQWYAIPWRYKTDSVYFIRQPQDIMGTPIIQEYPVGYFLTRLSENLENQTIIKIKNLKSLDKWKSVGGIFIFIVIVYILTKLG